MCAHETITAVKTGTYHHPQNFFSRPSPLHSPCLPRQLLICFLSLYINLICGCIEFHGQSSICPGFFGSGFSSCIIFRLHLCCIHQYSFLLLSMFHCLNVSQFVHSSVEGHLNCFILRTLHINLLLTFAYIACDTGHMLYHFSWVKT